MIVFEMLSKESLDGEIVISILYILSQAGFINNEYLEHKTFVGGLNSPF